MNFRDEDSVEARENREANRLPNPFGNDFDELLKSTIANIEYFRDRRGFDERKAREYAIEGACEGYELSSAAEKRLRAALDDARGVAP